MKLIQLCLLLTSILICSCTYEKKIEEINLTFHTENKQITLLYEDQEYPFEITGEYIGLPYNPEITNIGFVSANDTLKLKVKGGENVSVDFIINKKDTLTTLLKVGVKPVNYTKAYQKKNKGKYTAANPEVHELVNIMVAISEIGRLDSNMVDMRTPYYKSVISHFDRFKDHPVIDSLNNNITEVEGQSSYSYYYNIRMNANMYSFNANDNILNESPYKILGFNSESYVDELLPLMNDFAKKSDFKAFQKTHQKYHDSLVQDYYKLVDLKKMWTWIETKFPERYDGYKVYFSPLVNGAHAAQKFDDSGYKESIMFVNAPSFNDNYSDADKEAILARIVFTEIDHNYVNPATDKFAEIDTLLEPLECWNNGAQGYGNSYDTFNEYMTWAVFSLYIQDKFDSEQFERRNEADVGVISKGRGFVKFRGFNAFVLNWYKHNPDTSLEKLYPEVIEWIKRQDCKETPKKQ